MAQLAQRLGLDLPDALTSHGERLAHFFQGVLAAIFQAKAHLDDLLFARGQGTQNVSGLLLEVHIDHGLGRRDHSAVFDEVAKMRIFFLANRGLQRNRFLRDLQDFADLGHGDIHAPGNFFRRRLAAQFLHQLPRGADELVNGLDHMHRDADGARLVCNGARDGLPDPPGRIRRELVAAAILELIHRLHQADVAFLDQVEELQPAVGVLFGDGNHQAQVGFDELALGDLGVHIALDNLALGAAQLLIIDAGIGFQPLHINFELPLVLAVFLFQLLAAGGLGFLFQRLDLAVELPHGIHGLVDAVNQPLALRIEKADAADGAGNFYDLAAQRPAGAAVIALLLLLGNVNQLLGKLLRLAVVLGQIIDAVEGIFHALGNDLVGDFFFIKRNNFLDAANALPEVFAQRNDFVNNNGRARNRLQNAVLSALDALGNFHFAFAREQGHGAHFAQVHTHRIVGLFQRPGCEVQVNFFTALKLIGLVEAGGRRLGAFNDVNPLGADGAHEIVEIFRRMHIMGNQVIGLIVGEVALLFTRVN